MSRAGKRMRGKALRTGWAAWHPDGSLCTGGETEQQAMIRAIHTMGHDQGPFKHQIVVTRVREVRRAKGRKR